jgi:hypothetical protein
MPEQTMAAGDGTGATVAACQRRAVVRCLCGPEASALRWGRVLDASPYGLGLLLPSPIDAGAVLVVELRHPGLSCPHAALARVAHATAQPGGFLVGCSLLRRLPAAVFQALTADLS